MTAAEAVLAVGYVGGRLILDLGRVEVEVPVNSLGPPVLDALAGHREEIRFWLVAEREAKVARLLSAAYDRLSALRLRTPPEASAHRELGATVDTAAQGYIRGDGDLAAFESALVAWENALAHRDGGTR